MKQKRMLNFELLRILSMILIILLHSLSYGGGRSIYQYGDLGYFVMNILRGFAYLGVNCFVMLTGWFMCDMPFHYKRIVSIWFQIVFYGVIGLCITELMTGLSITSIINTFFPLTRQSYWFASCYVLLLFLQPLLNFIVEKSSKKQHKSYVISFLIIFSVVPTFLPWSKGITSSGTDIMWFITIYLFMAYIKKYDLDSIYLNSKSFSVILLLSGVMGGVLTDYLANGFLLYLGHSSIDKLFYYNNSLFFFIGAVGLFLLFKNISIDGDRKILEQVVLLPASTTFGIYLLHDNQLLRNVFWTNLNLLFPHSQIICINIAACFLKVMVIFVIGMIVDMGRQFLSRIVKVETISTMVDNLFNKISNNILG